MTKRFRRMRLTAAVCFAFVLCANAFLPLSRAAPRPARLPNKKPLARYLIFVVTAKGSGETQVGNNLLLSFFRSNQVTAPEVDSS